MSVMEKKCKTVFLIILSIVFLFFKNHSAMEVQITDVITDSNKHIALCEDGTVWSWNKKEDKSSAIRVDVENVKKIMDAGTAVYALTGDGEVYAWGDNNGQMISPNEERNKIFNKPVKLEGLEKIVDIDAKNGKAFAVDENGNFYSWGLYMYENEVLDYVPGFPESKEEIVEGVKYLSAGAGNYHYFIREDGSVFSIMESSMFDSNVVDFIFPQFEINNESIKDKRTLYEIPYTDLREGTKYALTVLYEIENASEIELLEADAYTVFMYKTDHTLWYWDSNTIKYHDNKNAISEVESCCENYEGSFQEINIKEIMEVKEEGEVPKIITICAAKENVLFLTDDGQVFISEYVTSDIQDVAYYSLSSTYAERIETSIISDMNIKRLNFRKLDWEDIISINTDGEECFSAVDAKGNCYYLGGEGE